MGLRRLTAGIAEGVHVLALGPRLVTTNIVFLSSESGWSLVDTGWSGSQDDIRQAAEQLFGPGTRPDSILLTHIHPDHSGSALALSRLWDRPVHVHPEEVRFAPGVYLPEYANPLDRRLVGPLLRLVPDTVRRRMEQASNVADVITELDVDGPPPGLADWRVIPTPGHTPGHIALFRPRDRVLVAGDALLTVDVNHLRSLVSGRQCVALPPRIATWDWELALTSVMELIRYEPEVLVSGHGIPMSSGVARRLRVWRPAPARRVHIRRWRSRDRHWGSRSGAAGAGGHR